MGDPMHILFMCVANSARSQMAEGLARHLFGESILVESAGSQPSSVNPLAVKAMQEIGIDITKHYSKSYDELKPGFIVQIDYVITLCAEEVCPTMVTPKAKQLRWPLPDPAGKFGSDEEQLRRFCEARDVLKERLRSFGKEIGIKLRA